MNHFISDLLLSFNYKINSKTIEIKEIKMIMKTFLLDCSHDNTHDRGAVELGDNRSLALKPKYLLKIIKNQFKKDHFIVCISMK